MSKRIILSMMIFAILSLGLENCHQKPPSVVSENENVKVPEDVSGSILGYSMDNQNIKNNSDAVFPIAENKVETSNIFSSKQYSLDNQWGVNDYQQDNPPAEKDNPLLLQEYNQKQNEQPLLFLENRGQIVDTEGKPRPDVLYMAKSAGAKVYITSSAIHYQFAKSEKKGRDTEITTHRFTMQLKNTNPSPSVETAAPETYTENYYNENFPDGLLGVRSFKEITMKDIYPGIDWVIYSKGSFMEYDFIVHPGADPEQIRFKINDADNISLTSNGDLKVETSLGEILKHAPVSYMGEELIASRLEQYKDGSFGFDVMSPKDKILRIDPYVEWGTYYGGTGDDTGVSCTLDAVGNVYLAGTTGGGTNIASGGFYNVFKGGKDAFLVKFNSNGTRLWATYYGGSGKDEGVYVAVSPSNYVYLVGNTESATGIAQGVPEHRSNNTLSMIRPMVMSSRDSSDNGKVFGFLVKFKPTGERMWGGYYSNRYDAKNNQSTGVSVGFNADGSQVYLLEEFYYSKGVPSWVQPFMWAASVVAAFIPGGGPFITAALISLSVAQVGVEIGLEYGISNIHSSGAQLFHLNAENGAYIADRTICANNSKRPVRAHGLAVGNRNILGIDFAVPYVLVSATDDRLQEGIGGTRYDYTANSGTLLNDDNYQAIVIKFSSNLSSNPIHRYYGGTGKEFPKAIAVDPQNSDIVYITGTTTSTTSIFNGGYDSSLTGAADAFLAKINMSTGNMIWSTYYGGTGGEIGTDVAIAPDGSVYLSGITTSSDGIADKGYDNLYSGEGDGFLTKFSSDGKTRLMSTYIGGISSDLVSSIAIRDNNKVYVAGTTHSENGIARGSVIKANYDSSSKNEAFLIKYTEPVPSDGKLYVKKDGTGDKTGRNWQNALPELADALVKAEYSSGINEIWVAAGEYKPIYRPDYLSAGSTKANSRLQSFKLVNNVKVYGGFVGTETTLSQRDLSNGSTSILSGVLGSANNKDDYAYHVVLAVGSIGTAELNGFTIKGGNATGSSSITVNGENISPNYGGAIRLYNSSPVLTNLIIKENYGSNGAGIANYNSSPMMTNLLFIDNGATGFGGAVHNENSNPVFTNVTIAGNTATSGGGAMRNFNSAPTIQNSIVLGGISNSSDNTVRRNSIVEGYADTTNGNLNGSTDPLFVNVLSGDYRLKDSSPAIEKGNNVYFPGAATTVDLAGNPRLTGTYIDMGAYEGRALNVYIPDWNFKSYLLNIGIDTDNDLEISYPEAEAYTGAINIYNRNIANLTGIEAFINITQLDCSSNNLTSLNVSKNTKLTDLKCNNNQLTSLNISQNTALILLSCYQNQLESLDVTQNTVLTELDCNNNQLESLDITQNTALIGLGCNNNELESLDVSKNTLLDFLICDNNQLTVLDISENTELTTLSVGNNQLTTLDVTANTKLSLLLVGNNQLTVLDISKNTTLQTLSCYGNQIESLDMSNNITNMYSLDCQNNLLTSLNLQNTNITAVFAENNPNLTCIQVDNVENAEANTNWHKDATANYNTHCEGSVYIPDANFKAYLLANNAININSDMEIQISEAANFTGTIDCSDLNIADLTGIEAFGNITQLNCSGNLLTVLDVTQNTALTILDCSSNNLAVLDVTKNTALTSLICNNNQLSALDVTQNTVLLSLNCNNNELSSLNVSQNVALKDLQCRYNQLMSLNLNTNTALEKLDCSNNEILGISFTQNPSLTHLYCNNNLLAGLNVSQNTALVELDCSSNQILGINVSQNTALKRLYCNNNELGNLNLNNNTALEQLDCSYNQLENLNVTKNTALVSLGCNNNQLTALDLTKNVLLIQLNCSDNEIANLDVTKNTVLTDMSCSNNKIVALNLSNNADLVNLYCDNNQLTSLDVSENTVLENLWCSQNLLKTLNAKNGQNDKILLFYAMDNPELTCIQVDNPAAQNNGWQKDDGASYSGDCSATLADAGAKHSDIRVFPNPVKDILHFSEEVTNIRITDMSGKMVKQISVKGKSVNVTHLPNGVYIITATTKAGNTVIKKIVKE